jgi:hypothetical protein
MENFQRIDKNNAKDFQVLNIKRAEVHALGMGYTADGNCPDNTARIEITGKPNHGTVTRFIVIFYPVGDTRLIKPHYSDRTTLTVTQTLAALPGWIAALTAIPTNEATEVVYAATADRYEFECVRLLTQK